MSPIEGTEEAERQKADGNAHFKSGRLAEAVAAYSRAIELCPQVAAYYSNRSTALLRSEDHAGSLRDADEAVRLEPKWAKAHLRRAKALQALQRHLDAAEACSQGAKTADSSEAKELRRLRSDLLMEAAVARLQGVWKGVVSKTLGGYEQTLHFKPDGKVLCKVYDQELDGTYEVKDVEVEQADKLHGGLDVKLGETFVPYLFRLPLQSRELHLCCPMTRPERPRTFDGPGYMSMSPLQQEEDSNGATEGGAQSSSGSPSLTEKLLTCLDELAEVMFAQMQQEGSSRRSPEEMAEELEELGGGGGTLSAEALQGGPESLEDREKRMASSQRLAALQVKYSKDVVELAHNLIQGKQDADSCFASAEEAREVRKRLRPFGVGDPPPPEAPASSGRSQALQDAPSASITAGVKEPLAHSREDGTKLEQQARQTASQDNGGCLGGCFRWLQRSK